jgi:hypothetical protein
LNSIKESNAEQISSIDVPTKQSLVDQLYFSKIDERLTHLTAALGRTCRWIYNTREYLDWQNPSLQGDHGGFLWIKGNSGTGKSTLMKLPFEDARLRAKDEVSQVTLSFFFLARGSDEEKSVVGLYRFLLHQLFAKVPQLQSTLDWMTADGARVIHRDGWHEEGLKHTLRHAVKGLGARCLAIYVDALDECDQRQVSDMVSFFEDLCFCAEDAQINMHVCFSSRHYPSVIIQKGCELTLEDELGHTHDIEQYIRSNLRVGKSKQADVLRTEILERSSRIFL